jgi:hypothetical protein
MPSTSNVNEGMSSPLVMIESPSMKMEEEPPSKKPRKDDDDRVHRAAMLMIKSENLSVPQVRYNCNYNWGARSFSFGDVYGHIYYNMSCCRN